MVFWKLIMKENKISKKKISLICSSNKNDFFCESFEGVCNNVCSKMHCAYCVS